MSKEAEFLATRLERFGLAKPTTQQINYCYSAASELRRLAEIERKYNEIMAQEPECYRFEIQCNDGYWHEVYDDEIRPDARRVTALYKLKKD